MKGIILAGGSGTRLYPLTIVTSKQLLPVYDKPMIYYPLSTLMLAGIKDILIISTPRDIEGYKELLKDGSQFGINLAYKIQDKPDGIASALKIGKEFIENKSCALILGDNIFYGNGLTSHLKKASSLNNGAVIFAYYVSDPQRFGVVEFDRNGKALSIEEKPEKPRSQYCVTGLYFYDGKAGDYVQSLLPSQRNEYEITDLNRIYLEKDSLQVITLGRGFAWLDTGTVTSLSEASEFVRSVETRQNIIISSPEEIAYNNSWITKNELLKFADFYGKSDYGNHLYNVAEGRIISQEALWN